MTRGTHPALSRTDATTRGPRVLPPLVVVLIGLLLFAGARACVSAERHVRLRNDFAGPVTVRRLDGAAGAARTLAPGETLVVGYAGKHHQLQEVGGLGTPASIGSATQAPAPVVLGVFTPEGDPLGRLVLPAWANQSYTMCLSAASEPPYRMGGAVRGGRPGAPFCPRGVITGGPPLP